MSLKVAPHDTAPLHGEPVSCLFFGLLYLFFGLLLAFPFFADPRVFILVAGFLVVPALDSWFILVAGFLVVPALDSWFLVVPGSLVMGVLGLDILWCTPAGMDSVHGAWKTSVTPRIDGQR